MYKSIKQESKETNQQLTLYTCACKWYTNTVVGKMTIEKHRPRVHKAFQNKDQDQARIKNSSTMDHF